MTTPMPSAQAAPAPNAHYVRLGGHAVVVRLVDAFYRAMDTRPDAAVIRAMHEPDLSATRRVLVKYLSEWMGGPRDYTPERGAPMLRRRHQPFDIDASARDAWMACMRQAMDEIGVEAGLRAELDAAFWKLADFIRNTEPGRRPVPADRAAPGEGQRVSPHAMAESGGSSRPHPGRPREVAPGQPAAAHTSFPTPHQD